jgi:hypothetical protein
MIASVFDFIFPLVTYCTFLCIVQVGRAGVGKVFHDLALKLLKPFEKQ